MNGTATIVPQKGTERHYEVQASSDLDLAGLNPGIISLNGNSLNVAGIDREWVPGSGGSSGSFLMRITEFRKGQQFGPVQENQTSSGGFNLILDPNFLAKLYNGLMHLRNLCTDAWERDAGGKPVDPGLVSLQ
jgi:hypothetical protein